MNRVFLALALCAAASPALACGPLSPALETTVQRSATAFGLDASLLKALLWTESHYCTQAVSPVGALGLGQLMPATAAALGVNPRDPHQNIYGAAKYLRQMWDHFHDWTFAIAAYNAGPGAVWRYHGVPPYRETQNYVRKVLTAYPQVVLAASGGALPQVAARPVSRPNPAAQAAAAPASRPPAVQTTVVRAASTRAASGATGAATSAVKVAPVARAAVSQTPLKPQAQAKETPPFKLIMFRSSASLANSSSKLSMFNAPANQTVP
jgi:Transglycosylase SLT domain